jgi:hypothetical protein
LVEFMADEARDRRHALSAGGPPAEGAPRQACARRVVQTASPRSAENLTPRSLGERFGIHTTCPFRGRPGHGMAGKDDAVGAYLQAIGTSDAARANGGGGTALDACAWPQAVGYAFPQATCHRSLHRGPYCAERRLVVELDGSSHAGQADLPQAERGPGVRFLKGALQPIRGHAVALGGMAGGH